jgi:hypothetical protein
MAAVGIIAVFGVLLYFMFVTKRTILRIFGWIVFFFAIRFTFIYINNNTDARANSAYASMQATVTINDLRILRIVTHMFYKEFETWPLPGQEASLDTYLDRQTAFVMYPRYANVMLTGKSGDVDSTPELYIGVELIPEKNGTSDVQKKLAGKAVDAGLFQQPASDDIYKSGLSVYMRIN